MKTSWLAEVQPTRFEEFLQAFWHSARLSADELPESPPDGVGELPSDPWPLSYALDRATQFAAFRWYQRDAENASAGYLRCELFFLCPASAAPRIGLRIFASSKTDLELSAPLWWTKELGLPSTPDPSIRLPGFMELVAILASRGNVSTTSADTQLAISDLTYELGYYRQLASETSEELRLTQSKVRDLLARPVSSGSIDQVEDKPEAPAPIEDLSGLAEWALKNSERITLLSRALNGAKKSRYENPAAVYAALEVLAGPYRDYRLAKLDKAGLNAALAAAGVQFAGAVGANVAGSHGDDYFVSWAGRRRFLEFHLSKGGGRDERYCMRIYFFWDDEARQVVVGSLPSHLNNSLS